MGLGKAFNALTKKGYNASKLKSTAALAVSRAAVLKNQRQARGAVARSDVVQLLRMGSQETALIRVEQVMMQQNTLDALVLIDSYCNLLIERIYLVEQEKSCPDELKEALSSLIFASARIGDFPELLQLRSILGSRFGKDFVSRAIELRNNCGVNPKMVQMLSTRMPALETRMKTLNQIAVDENINLPFETEPMPSYTETKMKPKYEHEGGDQKPGRRYKDVADAAQDAFESAAAAAAAARAAFELSRVGGGGSGRVGSPGKYGTEVKFDEVAPVEKWEDETKPRNADSDGGGNGEISESAAKNVNTRPVSVRTRRF